ncbi:assimilatory sulfite reductase (NADPH) hemoprotein subunit [Candidatus Tremblaya phenacola]|uniref:assimilatory sulfite reductase (NADPH) hemoprotein subunit n=1 Tax=Candidatus Tremblayella phenacoccinincola TaxID=1010676 RepID=UPI00132FCA76|nr:assimilatory sulfite reductase (NADPH) hemoprotein subunit [Candidatus Tremblaya phenacola]KAH0998161.1 Sulfite reductase [NADPH] hemoprotein beta-component [Candidatus Tremblaya phenacola]
MSISNSSNLSNNEILKKESSLLRGSISKDIKVNITGGFNYNNSQLIRFHGMYQQDDRDLRKERLKQKLEPLVNIMLRCRLPGGIITTKQWVNINRLATENTLYNNIRLTTRQTFQLHGILKANLKNVHKVLNKIELDSIATAGDVNRNILCSFNPKNPISYFNCWFWSKKISVHLLPKSKSYAELWLKDKKTDLIKAEPILGNSYLPRKFKIAITIPPVNDVDIYSNDIGLIAVNKLNNLIGFNIVIGGGLSIVHNDKKTYPKKANEIGYIFLNEVIKISEAIITIQRDFGNRNNRKAARTKYTLDKVSISLFRKEIEKRTNLKLKPIYPYIFNKRNDNFGWLKGTDKRWYLTLFVQNGRITDCQDKLLKTGLEKIAKIHNKSFCITPNQNIIITDVSPKAKPKIESIIKTYNLINRKESIHKRKAMACVSFPTCPLAMAEAERFLMPFLNKLEKLMVHNNIHKESIVLRIAGCPNGCSRAMLSEICLVGKSIGKYNVYLGGNYEGTRIPKLYKENANVKEILKTINKTSKGWIKYKRPNEPYGSFIIRTNLIKPVINSANDFYSLL